MPTTLTVVSTAQLMDRVCERIVAAEQELGELDARAGDGDLGVTLATGARAVREVLRQEHASIADLLTACGQTLRRVAPSTSGTLLASGLLAAGREARGWESLGTKEAAEAGRRVEQSIKSLGGAQVGDRTMLDALVPACDALDAAAELGVDLQEALQAAAAAAAAAARSTANLTPKIGRSSYLGERAVGAPDAGAMAVAAALQAAAEAGASGK